MTVRGDLWAVCMVCTPTCDTFPSEGRRVSSQILLTLLHSLVPLWTGRFAGLSYISSLSLGLLVVMFWCDVSHLSFLGYSWLCLGSVVTYCAPITVILPPPVYDSQYLVYLTSTLLDGIHDLLHMLPFHSPPVGLPPTFLPHTDANSDALALLFHARCQLSPVRTSVLFITVLPALLALGILAACCCSPMCCIIRNHLHSIFTHT